MDSERQAVLPRHGAPPKEPSGAPFVAVWYRGTKRCANMCGFLRRHGLDVLCTRDVEVIREIVTPDLVFVRVDRRTKGLPAEFRALRRIRQFLPQAALLVQTHYVPSDRERAAVKAVSGALVVAKGGGFPAMLGAVLTALPQGIEQVSAPRLGTRA